MQFFFWLIKRKCAENIYFYYIYFNCWVDAVIWISICAALWWIFYLFCSLYTTGKTQSRLCGCPSRELFWTFPVPSIRSWQGFFYRLSFLNVRFTLLILIFTGDYVFHFGSWLLFKTISHLIYLKMYWFE